MKRLLFSFFILLWVVPVMGQDSGFSFEMMEPTVKKESQESQDKFDEAKSLIDQEKYSEGLNHLETILADSKAGTVAADAEYLYAKALQRQRLHHSALERFGRILSKGAGHPYFENSKEWVFFISQEVRGQSPAFELISAYSSTKDVPEKRKAQIQYQLAKYHFTVGMRMANQTESESGAAPAIEEEEEESPESGGFDFGEEEAIEEDPSDDIAAPEDGAPPAKPPARPAQKESKPTTEPEEEEEEEEDGEFDFSDFDFGGGDDDDFDFDFGEVETKKKKKKKARTKKRKRSKIPSKKSKPGKASSEKIEEKKPAPTPREPTEIEAVPVAAMQPKMTAATPEEAYAKALSHVTEVDESSLDYGRAVYLRGLIEYALGKYEESVDSFRKVVRMTHPTKGTVQNPKLREMAFFSLARIHYQFEQFRYAIFYYDRIDRDSEAWLDSLFEKSWAFFRLGKYEKALGNLVTIQSPFFSNAYYPEGHILKAITYYENCRFPEAELFLKSFKADYDAVVDELDRILEEKRSYDDFLSEHQALKSRIKKNQEGNLSSVLLVYQILDLGLADERIDENKQAMNELNAELQVLKGLPGPYRETAGFTTLSNHLEQSSVAIDEESAGFLFERLEEERRSLRQLTSMLVRIQFEIAKQEKVSLEAELRGENQTVSIENYFYSTATDDERLYWPFDGEYWRDELGTYEYTLTKGCRPPEDDN
jgi:tetratricopeptide (TPR) repeat protein